MSISSAIAVAVQTCTAKRQNAVWRSLSEEQCLRRLIPDETAFCSSCLRSRRVIVQVTDKPESTEGM